MRDSINNHKPKHQFCKYCKKEMQEFDCTSLKSDRRKKGFLGKVFDLWCWFEIPYTSFLIYAFDKAQDKTFEKNGKTITCTNPHCIGYLDGCHNDSRKLDS